MPAAIRHAEFGRKGAVGQLDVESMVAGRANAGIEFF
jgi:hypothetical protein